jgi:hypothetical protein
MSKVEDWFDKDIAKKESSGLDKAFKDTKKEESESKQKVEEAQKNAEDVGNNKEIFIEQ